MTNVHCTQPGIDDGGANLPPTMRAVQQHRYGGVEVLEVAERAVPEVPADRVLVRVHRAALNPLDWHMMTGLPWLLRPTEGFRRPKRPVRGVDLAGVVVAVGAEVDGVAVGARVFGGGAGALADYAVCAPSHIAPLPAAMSMTEAAALPVAGVTALQGLRDHGRVSAGTTVLVNGAAGGVGTYAVQIAKHLGAEVTAVCSTRNVDMVRRLGADHVVDYTTDDVMALGRRYDVILDNVGNWPLRSVRGLLVDDGVLVMVSGPKRNRLLGPVGRIVRAKLRFALGSQRAVVFTAEETSDELRALAALADSGVLRSEIERVVPLAETADTIAYMATGHARAKLIVDVSGEPDPG